MGLSDTFYYTREISMGGGEGEGHDSLKGAKGVTLMIGGIKLLGIKMAEIK